MYLLIVVCILDCTEGTGSYNQTSDAFLQHHQRHRRAPGDVDNLQALARITTGIALEIGLMDGTIPSDDVIAELLQIGTVKPNDIIGLQKDVITGALTELQNLPVSDQDTKEVEKRLIYLDSLRLTSGFMKNFSKFPGRDEYLYALKDVKELEKLPKVDFDYVKNSASRLEIALGIFENALSDLNDQQVLDIEADLPAIRNRIEKVEAAVKNLTSLVPLLTNAKKLLKHADFYEILNEEKKIRDGLEWITFDIFYENVKAHLNTIESSRLNFVASKPSFETLRLLFASRDSLAQPSFQYTYGLPNGYSDLGELIKDVKNPWIESRLTNNTVVVSSLERAFTPLILSAHSLSKVVKSWKPMSDPVSRKPIQSVLDAHSSTFDLKGDLQQILKTLDELKKCEKDRGPAIGDFAKIKPIMTNITNFNNEMAQLTTFDYAAELENLKPVRDILSPSKTVDKAVATEIVQKLKALPLFQKLTDGLKRLQSDLVTVPDLAPKLSSQVNEIRKGFPHIKKYHSDVNQPKYIAFFGCLKAVGDKSATAANAIKLLQKTQLDTKVTTEAKNLIEKIIDSGSDLTVARDQIKGVKKSTDREMLEMKSSFSNSDSLETSQSLGQAVQGLLAIQAAHNKRKELDPLLNDIPKILGDSTGLYQENQTSLSHLNKLKKTFDDIEDFQKTLNDVKSHRKKRAADFKSVGSIFDDAKLVSGFTEDVEKIQKALDVLYPIKSYSPALESLKTLNLNFDGFQNSFTEAKASLNIVDIFFMEYTKRMNNPPSAAPINKNPNAFRGQLYLLATSSESTTKAGFDIHDYLNNIYIWITVFLILFLIAAVVLISIYLCHRDATDRYEPPDDPEIEKGKNKKKKEKKGSTDLGGNEMVAKGTGGTKDPPKTKDSEKPGDKEKKVEPAKEEGKKPHEKEPELEPTQPDEEEEKAGKSKDPKSNPASAMSKDSKKKAKEPEKAKSQKPSEAIKEVQKSIQKTK